MDINEAQTGTEPNPAQPVPPESLSQAITDSGNTVKRKTAKIDPRKLNASWEGFERRVPWSYVNSRELARILGVHIQTISNWHIRGILPPPAHIPRKRANCRWYEIAALRAWLEGREREPLIWDWLNKNITIWRFKSIEQAQEAVKVHYKRLGFERPN